MIVVNRRGNGRLLFAAYPMGYGPAAKALVLAARCHDAGLESVFVGRGVAHELVARSEGVFAQIVKAGAEEPAARALTRDARAVVSVMDRDMARLAGEFSRPLHVVDSLLWMRDRVPEVFLSARRYWAQRFRDDEPTGQRLRPSFVGPILGTAPRPPPAAAGPEIIVNLGGFEASGSSERDHRYAQLVLQAIDASAPNAYPGRIRILATARLAEAMRPSATRLGVETASLGHSEALAGLAAAKVILSAPGLTTTLECFQLGRPTFFLPPRNFSQWCILKTLRGRGLAPHALHWEDFGERFRLGDRMPDEVRNPRVHAAIDELVVTRAAREAVARLFTYAAAGDHDALKADQNVFLRSLGGDGAEAIAGHLADGGN